jgi:hypothetical protein
VQGDHTQQQPSTPTTTQKAKRTARLKHGRRAVGFVAMMRTPDADELIECAPLAFGLAAVIARRARYMPGVGPKGQQQGEAFIGDHRHYGMSRQQYRTALARLTKWGFVTIRTTRRGTIARLMDTRLFDVLNVARSEPVNHLTNHQPTISQPLSNKATKKQGNKGTTGTGVARLHPPPSSCPSSVTDVVVHAFERAGIKLTAEETACMPNWLDAGLSTQTILDDILNECMRECVALAFRFIRYNNSKGWRLHSWRSAFDGFDDECSFNTGASEVPSDWTPRIEWTTLTP